MKRNEGPQCAQCRDGMTERGQTCVYCQGQGRVQSLEQWVEAGKPRTPREVRQKRTE